MTAYKLDHPNCKVWRASEELLQALPPATRAPKFRARYANNQIAAALSDGLPYITCLSCDWHNDDRHLFEYVVVRGNGRLYIADQCDGDIKPHTVCPVERGDVIQLWSLAEHRVTTRSSLAMLDRTGPTRRRFRSQAAQERLFLNMIRFARAGRGEAA